MYRQVTEAAVVAPEFDYNFIHTVVDYTSELLPRLSLGTQDLFSNPRYLASLHHKVAEFIIDVSLMDNNTQIPSDTATVSDSLKHVVGFLEPAAEVTSSKDFDPVKYHKRHIENLERWLLPANEKTRLVVSETNPITGEMHNKEKVIKGGSILKLVTRHKRDTERRVNELRNKTFTEAEEPVTLLGVLDDGTLVVELTTKKHLEEESVVNNHCIGTESIYFKNLKRNRSRFFSIRVPDTENSNVYRHYSIEYDVNLHSILQIKTMNDLTLKIDNIDWHSVIRSLKYLKQSVLNSPDKNLTIRDIPNPPKNHYITIDGRVKELKEISIEDKQNILAVDVTCSFDTTAEDLPDDLPQILSFESCNFTFNGSVNAVLSEILKGVTVIGGNANFRDLTNAKGLGSLTTIGGSARFFNLKNAEGLESLEFIGGYAEFRNLKNAKGLGSLTTIGDDALFNNLTNAKGLESLEFIGGYANFRSLKNAKGLGSLTTIGGSAHFDNLKNAKGLEFLTTIDGNAIFSSLRNVKGLSSLKTIANLANFRILTNANGLVLLESIGEDPYFTYLISLEGLESLTTIDGNAIFPASETSMR